MYHFQKTTLHRACINLGLLSLPLDSAKEVGMYYLALGILLLMNTSTSVRENHV
jgi:hypothetical protein